MSKGEGNGRKKGHSLSIYKISIPRRISFGNNMKDFVGEKNDTKDFPPPLRDKYIENDT